MASNLTGSTIASTYSQLLHVDGGLDATEKTVYSGTGTATAVKIGTVSFSVDNVQLDGNTIRTLDTNGNLTLAPNGTGSVIIPKASITGGSITGITDLAIADGGTGASTAVDARANLGLGNIATQDANSVSITGGSIAGVAIGSGLVPRGYGIFYDLGDQTFSADTPTTITFDTVGIADDISVVSNTRITFAEAGTYEVTSRLQFNNADSSDHVADIWFRLDGSDIPYSASEISVPKLADGGKTNHTITGILTVTAGQYLEVVVATEDADVSLHYHAPFVTPGDAYNRPAVPSSIIVVRRVI